MKHKTVWRQHLFSDSSQKFSGKKSAGNKKYLVCLILLLKRGIAYNMLQERKVMQYLQSPYPTVYSLTLHKKEVKSSLIKKKSNILVLRNYHRLMLL